MIFCLKPTGINSHRVSDKKNRGFVEFIKEAQPDLTPLHRLDRETSGLMAFAENKEELNTLGKQFADHQVEKTYLFISQSENPVLAKTDHSSFIEKQKGEWVSTSGQEANAWTELTHLKSFKNFHLYAAKPKSGKTHQVRLHAKDLGIPILGDSTYGGEPFHRLCLHCKQMTFKDVEGAFVLEGDKVEKLTPEKINKALPEFFKNLKLLDNRFLCQVIDCILRRNYLYPKYFSINQSIRLSHKDGDPLRIDKLGEVLWMGWWQDDRPNKIELQEIVEYLTEFHSSKILLQHRTNREKNSTNPVLFEREVPEQWLIHENSMIFEMRKNQGFSPGLFLDQRANRNFVKDHSKDKKVLNLFSYTGGFSLAAALGGAKETWSVDTSKTYINWSKSNFEHNQLNIEDHKFYQFDSQEFLNWAHKKSHKFDLIICDPPSFGRSGKKVFKLNKDWVVLAEEMAQVLAPGGMILFSCNLESWKKENFINDWTQFAKNHGFQIRELPHPDLDFEQIDEEPNLKSILLKK